MLLHPQTAGAIVIGTLSYFRLGLASYHVRLSFGISPIGVGLHADQLAAPELSGKRCLFYM